MTDISLNQDNGHFASAIGHHGLVTCFIRAIVCIVALWVPCPAFLKAAIINLHVYKEHDLFASVIGNHGLYGVLMGTMPSKRP